MIQIVNPTEIINSDTALKYQIILITSEDGHFSWTGNRFEIMDDTHASFFDMKGIDRSIAAAEYDKALKVAQSAYTEGNLQLIGLLRF